MNLANYFLMAIPSMNDPFFEGSVVYLCEHNEEGAMGVVINKPSPVTMDLVFEAAGGETPERFRKEWVMMGGPVQIDRGFVLHTPVGSWQSSLMVTDNIAMTTSRDIIENLAKDNSVDQAIITIGYASWEKGQLERELADNSWITVPADEEILFKTPHEERYQAAFAKLGIEPSALIGPAGHA
ncbi:MAG: YqgE/AlgH family protein [Neisseria sp.]